MKRSFLAVFWVAAMGVAAVGRSAERPNIVWLFSDDHAVQAIGAYGGRLGSGKSRMKE